MIADDFLGQRAQDAPSGDDLEYDPAFMELMVAAQPGQERQAGSEIVAGTEPDWKGVARMAQAVLERSHDLRVAVVLAQAQVKLEGYEGVAPALAYVRGCLERWWDSCHPQLDADDDNDPTMRINAVTGLSDGDGFLRLLRLAPLAESRTFGRINLRDLAVASGEITAAPGATAPDAASVAAAFKETPAEVLKAKLPPRVIGLTLRRTFADALVLSIVPPLMVKVLPVLATALLPGGPFVPAVPTELMFSLPEVSVTPPVKVLAPLEV
jgi:type VI secretion system protein ImpA